MAEYINRGTAIAKLTALEVTEPNATMTSAKRLLADMPAADVVEVVHGRWLDGDDYMFCSKCGMQWNYCDNDTQDFNYCPNCGAKMGGGDDDAAD